MKFVYEFVGGPLNGVIFDHIDAVAFSSGDSGDLSNIRNAGGTVRRKELDNQPTFDGYLGPMWDGERIKGTDGKYHYSFERTFIPADPAEKVFVLRYETQEVYDLLSR